MSNNQETSNNPIGMVDDNNSEVEEQVGISSLDKMEYSRKITWKNIIMMSFIFMLTYTSYTGLFALQSSLHPQAGIGVICTSIRYIVLVISSMFLPEILINIIGHKWTVTVSLISFVLWMAANGYSVWATMVPASVLNGLFVGPLWAAQGSYFTELAKEYAEHTQQKHEGVTSLFFGVFCAFYLGSSVFGSIISTTLLQITPSANMTKAVNNKDIQQHCGLNVCPWNEHNDTHVDVQPARQVVWTLVGVYIVISILAIILSIVAVDNLPKHMTNKRKQKTLIEKLRNLLLSALQLLKSKELWLLVPITMYTGIEETNFFAEYNLSWVTCGLGIWMIGYVNVPFGLSSALMSYISGYAAKTIGRVPIMCIALILDVSIQLTLAFWKPVPAESESTWVYYIIALVWGTYHGVWLTVTTALYGIAFPFDTGAAYSNYMTFQCLGYAAAFGYSFFLCSDTKLYIMSASLFISIVCYFILELVLKQKKVID